MNDTRGIINLGVVSGHGPSFDRELLWNTYLSTCLSTQSLDLVSGRRSVVLDLRESQVNSLSILRLFLINKSYNV